MSAPLLLDLSHTSHTRARTGIQRVTRSLRAALADRAVGITHDPYRSTWRELEPWELENVTANGGAKKRGARWPLDAKLRGIAQRWLGSAGPIESRLSSVARQASGVLIPEVFSPGVARALPALFAATRGPKVAIFHDAIALRFPEFAPSKTVARFPAYLQELLAFDGIAAISEDSRRALLDYWEWLGIAKPPRVTAIPLGISAQISPSTSENFPIREPPIVLSVGSIEGRKNHLALLEACEQLWARGEKFSLHLIGLAQPQTGAAALERIRTLQAGGRPLQYGGPAPDAVVEAAYAGCTFTVYPSLVEGFGLPVIESLAHGKPCICSGRGALGESARDGGCVALDSVDAASLATAMARLLANPGEVMALAAQARARRLRTWTDYSHDLIAWMRELGTSRNAR